MKQITKADRVAEESFPRSMYLLGSLLKKKCTRKAVKTSSLLFFLFLLTQGCFAQEDSIAFEDLDWSMPNPWPKQTQEADLSVHRYWSSYLIRNGKESLQADSSVFEAYRLIYWGQFFSIVEIIKVSDQYVVKADSSAWGMNFHKIFRSQDTLYESEDIEYIRQYCWSHKDEKRFENEVDISNTEDDRDNWAFEYKIDSIYRSRYEIVVPEELAKVYQRMMKLGKLSGYKIYLEKSK